MAACPLPARPIILQTYAQTDRQTDGRSCHCKQHWVVEGDWLIPYMEKKEYPDLHESRGGR